MEDERAWFISFMGDESEEGIERVFLALERRKTTRDFVSLYRTLLLARKWRGVLERRLLVDVFAGIRDIELGLDQFQLHLILL